MVPKNEQFRILIVGSRSLRHYELVRQTIGRFLIQQNVPNEAVEIVSGGASGADALAEEFAKRNHLGLTVFAADWEKHGKSAGFIRNEEMHRYIAETPNRACFAFWDGSSSGTAHSFSLAEKYKNPLQIITYAGLGNVSIERADLFEKAGFYAHCISADFALGAGIAARFAQEFDTKSELRRAYPGYTFRGGDCLLAGKVLNLVTKDKCYQKPTYESMAAALARMKEVCAAHGITRVVMPKIGCGLDKLEWDRVLSLLVSTFDGSGIQITVCDLLKSKEKEHSEDEGEYPQEDHLRG